MKKALSLFIALVMVFTFSAATVAHAEAMVMLNVEVSPSEMREGGEVTLSITVSNDGDAVSNAVLYVDGNMVEELGNLSEFMVKDPTIVYTMTADKLGRSIPVRVDYEYNGETLSEEGSFKVEKKEANISVATRATVDKEKVTSGDTVLFTFNIENHGDTTITDAVLTAPPLKNGGQIGNTFTLEPGKLQPIEYEVEVTSDVTVKPVLTYKAEGESYTANFDAVSVRVDSAEVELTLTAGNTSIQSGGTVDFTLSVENTGRVDLQDIEIKNPFGQILTLERTTLSAGSSMDVTDQLTVVDSGMLSYSVTAKDKNGNTVTQTSNSIEVFVEGVAPSPSPTATASAPALTLSVTADTKTKPGKVIFNIVVGNTGSTPVNSIKISEHTFGQVGSLPSPLASGEQTLTYEADFSGSTPVTYTFEVEGTVQDGSSVSASTVVMATPSADNVPNSISTLLIIIIVIIVAIIGLGVALIIVLRKDKAKKAAAAADAADRRESSRGRRTAQPTKAPAAEEPAPKPRSVAPAPVRKPPKKFYDDRNNL